MAEPSSGTCGALHIRRARPTDAAAVAALISELGYPCSAREMGARLRALLPRRDIRVAVAVEGKEILGVVAAGVEWGIEAARPRGRVTALCVAPGKRGRGVGALLLAAAESWFRSRGAGAAFVNSAARRREAHRFYEREGYRVTGLRFVKELAADPRGVKSACSPGAPAATCHSPGAVCRPRKKPPVSSTRILPAAKSQSRIPS